MTNLIGDLRSIMGTPFGGVGHAVLIFSRVTRAAFDSDSVILQLHDRIDMPEDAAGKFRIDNLDPGPVRVELEGGTVHNHGWNIDLPDEGTWSLADLVDAQVDWSPAVIGRAEAAARESRDHADRAEVAADRVGTAEQVSVWASEASGAADAAALSEANAKQSELAASGYADNADSHANRAESAADTAAGETVTQVRSEFTGMLTSAEAARDAAGVSETNAAQSEADAAGFADLAEQYKTAAETAKDDAAQSKNDAALSASAADGNAAAAATSASSAAQSESSAGTHAQNASDAADRIGTAATVETWVQQAQSAADRVGSAEQVGAWASETSEASARAELAALNAEASENNAQTAASEIRNRTPVLVRGKTTRDLKDAIEESIRIYPDTTRNNRAVYLPAGDYLVEPDAFSDIDMSGTPLGIRDGLKFTGDGKGATRLILQTNGVESWFYDNKSVSNRFFQELTFEGITFMADSMEYGNGFKQWSSGGEKRFRFINCGFDLNTVLHTLGTGNADLNRFENCRVVANTTVILENPQSVANGFHNCDFTVRRSLVKMIRGGSFWVTMGNLEMWQADGDDGSEMHYLIDASDSVLAADGSLEFNLTNVRFEIHGINKGLVSVNDSAAGVMQANFTRCTWGTVSGGVREVVRIGSASRVTFDNCVLHRDFRYVAATTMTNLSAGAMIEFNRCYIGRGERLWEQCETVGEQARIIARGCFRQSLATSALIRNPQDFDMGWRTSPSYAVLPEIKTVSLKKPTQAMPTPRDSSGDLRVRLPDGSYLKRLYFHSGADAGLVGSYQLHIGSTDKSEVYASSEEVEASEGVDIEIRDIGFSGDQETRIWATGTVNSFWTGGESSVAFLEYI